VIRTDGFVPVAVDIRWHCHDGFADAAMCGLTLVAGLGEVALGLSASSRRDRIFLGQMVRLV
jgi:hypothetical protein